MFILLAILLALGLCRLGMPRHSFPATPLLTCLATLSLPCH